MNEIKLTNILTPVPEKKIVDLLFELMLLYGEAASTARAYNDMEDAVRQNAYYSRHMAKRVLDGALSSRDAEMAHIRDSILFRLRDFFEPLTHGPSE